MHHPKTKITCTNKIGPVITEEVGEVEEGGLQENCHQQQKFFGKLVYLLFEMFGKVY